MTEGSGTPYQGDLPASEIDPHATPMLDAAAPWRELPAPFAAGQLVAGRYRVVRQLGRGGMGVVYEVDDNELHERIALKTIAPDLAHDDRYIARLKRELQLARRVTHPNVCRIFDVGFHDDVGRRVAFVTMELLEGETLAAVLRRDGPMRIDALLPLARQMAAALDAAHNAGVVHRDFKPGNVMLVRGSTPGALRVVVTDFGLARDLRPASPDNDSDSGRITGTPAYMAPEQVSTGRSDAASDLYAFGLVVYETVTGVLPFTGETPLAMLLNRLTTPAVSPRSLNADLTAAQEAAILRCLARDPRDRFASATEAVDAMTVPGIAEAPRRTGGVMVLAIVLLAVALLGTIAFVLLRPLHAPVAPAAPVAARRTVAVLGFRNLAQRPDASWLSTALAEMLSTELAAGSQLRLIPGEQVARAKADLRLAEVDSHSADTLARIRENLDVDYVVLGSYLVVPNATGRALRLDVRVQDVAATDAGSAFTLNGSEEQLIDLVGQTGAELRRRLGVDAPAGASTTARALPRDARAAQLYAEGLEKLRLFDASAASELLQRAADREPGSPRIWGALAAARSSLGYEKEAQYAAGRASALASTLSREESLFAEARYRESTREWEKAVESYRALFESFPDNVEYGLGLAAAQTTARHANDALRTIAQLRRLPRTGDDPRIDLAEADAAKVLADFKQQLSAAERARRRAETIGARVLEARAWAAIAWVHRNQDRQDESIAAANRAIDIFRATGDRLGEVSALNTLGSVRFDQGRLEEAEDVFGQLLAIGRATGDRATIGRGLNNVALMELQRGHLAAAEPLYREALALFREMADTTAVGRSLNNLAEVPYLRGEVAAARKLDEEALALARSAGERWLIANILFDLGDLELAAGDPSDARRTHEEALQIRRTLGDSGIANESLISLGEVALAEGDARRAEQLAREVLGATSGKRRDNERLARVLLARALLREDRRAEAVALAKDASVDRDSENAVARYSTRMLESLVEVGEVPSSHAALSRLDDLAVAADDDGLALVAMRTRLEAASAAARVDAKRARTLADRVVSDARRKGLAGFTRQAEAIVARLQP